jgi:O-antigen/teichoic acid export membrane protein
MADSRARKLIVSGLRRLTATTSRRRIIDSTVWSIGERAITLGLTWTVSIVVANYLGVSDYGQLMYAIALASLFTLLASAGLSGIVVRDLVRAPEERHEILGTVFVVRLLSGTLCLAVLVGSTFVLGSGASSSVLIAIVAVGLCFRAADVVEFWFQSQTELRYVAMASIVGSLLESGFRILLVVLGASLVHFAWATALGQLLYALLLLWTYRRTVGPLRLWRFRRPRALAYLHQSWPLILSGAANSINLRVDQVLLGVILGSSAVGTYAVAARLSEIWYLFPTIVVSALFPSIIRAKERGEKAYRRRLQQLYGFFAWSAVGVAVVMTIAAGPLIDTLYNSEYSGAAAVLVIHVWTAPFLFMGVIFSKWLIIEGMLYSSLIRHGFGASLNIALNLVLIPSHGPVGSAIATLVSYAAATYGACFLTRRTWPVAVDMTMGLLLPFRAGYSALRRAPALAVTEENR